MIEQVSILTALGAGIATFLAPCTFVTLPVFLSYIIGATAEEIKQGGRKGRVNAVLNTVFYVVGFTVVFVLLGMTATTVGSIFLRNREIFMKLGGIFVILFGFFMIFGNKIKFLHFLYVERKGKLTGEFEKYKFIRALLIGVTSAFAWTPCVGPLLGSILFYAGATTSEAWQGGFLLFVYSLGISLPFFLFAYLIGIGSKFAKKLNGYVSIIHKVSGFLLVLLGLMLLTNTYGYLFEFFNTLFVRLGYSPL